MQNSFQYYLLNHVIDDFYEVDSSECEYDIDGPVKQVTVSFAGEAEPAMAIEYNGKLWISDDWVE